MIAREVQRGPGFLEAAWQLVSAGSDLLSFVVVLRAGSSRSFPLGLRGCPVGRLSVFFMESIRFLFA